MLPYLATSNNARKPEVGAPPKKIVVASSSYLCCNTEGHCCPADFATVQKPEEE